MSEYKTTMRRTPKADDWLKRRTSSLKERGRGEMAKHPTRCQRMRQAPASLRDDASKTKDDNSAESCDLDSEAMSINSEDVFSEKESYEVGANRHKKLFRRHTVSESAMRRNRGSVCNNMVASVNRTRLNSFD